MNLNIAPSVQSDFSVGKSLLQIEHIIEKAKEHGYETVTLCDQMSLNGMVDFSNRAKKAGIKPIIGCRIVVYDRPTYRKPTKASGDKELANPTYTLKVYLTEESGMKSLLKLLSKANTAEYFYYHARCGLEDVLALEGVCVSTGDIGGLFSHPDAASILAKLQERFGSDKVFVELVPANTPLFDTLNAKAISAATLCDAATLVTYPMLYRDAEDASTLDVLGAIATNTQLDVRYRPKQYVKDFYFAEPAKIVTRIKDASQRVAKWNGVSSPYAWGSGLKNVEVLANLCTYEFKKMDVCLPVMAENEFAELGRKCVIGWKNRFTNPVLGYLPAPADLPKYQARLRYELGVLKKMKFAGYFLLVEDLVTWSKNNGIIVGPGRGSSSGSLVAYLLGITDVDPIRFNLLFERFINPDRIDLPDADLDFMSSKRHLVVEYLIGKYGKEHVAGISNYSSLASASALRDTGRMFGLTGIDLMATKLVPKEHGASATLTDAANEVPELDKFRIERPEIWGHALKLEGVMKSFGQHAAGVIVAGAPLIERAVVETRGESPVVAWDKRSVEDWGLIKMDLLGLSTLDVLEIAKGYIKDRHGVTVDYLSLPLELPEVMDAFGRGQTTGVFQFESSGMAKLLKSLGMGGRLTFEDITAATALYRPGPMDSGLMDQFIHIKQGTHSPTYEHPKMEAALADTQGVIVYQEQVMRIAVDLAGFTGGEADTLRKIMGKKDKDKMAEMKDKWVDGCVKHSEMDPYRAEMLFDKIEKFAGYGFNKSHATAYSVISVWTMWVRVKYPAEYFAACMSIVKDDKLPGLVMDARACGIEVLPPNINLSTARYTIPDDKHILAPFSCVMGTSENTANRIVAMRKDAGGHFTSKEHFALAASAVGSKVNATVVARLDKVGAYASIEAGTLPARHLDRRRDQTELMPGLIIDAVKSDRTTDASDKFLRAKIITLVQEYKKCEGCSLAGNPHPTIRVKANVKFMVVTDSPTWEEEKKDKLMEGEASMFVKAAIKDAGLSVGDGYFTTLVKSKKSDKFLTNEQINGCKGFLDREVALIKPSIIIALGSAAIKHFIPGIKGGTADMVGKVVYDAKLDANIVCGINAQQCCFDASKGDLLVEVFTKVADILS